VQRVCDIRVYREETLHQNQQKKKAMPSFFVVGPNFGEISVGVARVEPKNILN
jgi:hypothetical protein